MPLLRPPPRPRREKHPPSQIGPDKQLWNTAALGFTLQPHHTTRASLYRHHKKKSASSASAQQKFLRHMKSTQRSGSSASLASQPSVLLIIIIIIVPSGAEVISGACSTWNTLYSWPVKPYQLGHSFGFAGENGRLFLFGGCETNSAKNPNNHLQAFDLASRKWIDLSSSTKGSPPSPRSAMGLVAYHGKIYVFGGKDFRGKEIIDLHEYDIASGTWTDLSEPLQGTPPRPENPILYRPGSFAVAVSDATLYVLRRVDGDQTRSSCGTKLCTEPRWHRELHEYNIALRAWTDLSSRAKGSPPPPESLLGISLVAYKRKLYAYGGVRDIHEYDLASDTWTPLETTSGTPPDIRQYAGFAVHEGKFIVFGGYVNKGDPVRVNDMHMFDAASSAWTELQPLNKPSPRAVATLPLIDGKLYVLGGTEWDFYGNGIHRNEGERPDGGDLLEYDIASGAWHRDLSAPPAGAPPRLDNGPFCVAAHDGKVLVLGTATLENSLQHQPYLREFDLELRAWTETFTDSTDGALRTSFRGFGCVVADHKLIVYGEDRDRRRGGRQNELHQLDLASGEWADLTPERNPEVFVDVPSPRQSDWTMGMAASNGKVYVFGGRSASGTLINDLYAYDVVSLWTDLSNPSSGTPPSPRLRMGFAENDGKLYVFGGDVAGHDPEYGELHQYDIASSSWTDLSVPLSGPPATQELFGMTASNGKLYVFGGGDGGNDLHRFDIASATWTDLSRLACGTPPPERQGVVGQHSLISHKGDLYLYNKKKGVFHGAVHKWHTCEEDSGLCNILPGCKVVAPGTAVCSNYDCQEQAFRHPEEAGVCNVCVELQNERPSHATPTTASISHNETDNLTAALVQSAGSTFYSIARDGGDSEQCCPFNISNTVVEANAWSCGVRCRAGSWWDPRRAHCSPCRPKPDHSRWSDGNCTYSANAGFWCNVDVGECSSCLEEVQKPSHAEWEASSGPGDLCPYRCRSGFFGHPTPRLRGQCLTCKEYMKRVGPGAVKPAHSEWGEGVLECTGDSWRCNAGFEASATAEICCPGPSVEPNAQPAPGVGPCDLVCNLGFWWDDERAECAACSQPPENTVWDDQRRDFCSYLCAEGYYALLSPLPRCTEGHYHYCTSDMFDNHDEYYEYYYLASEEPERYFEPELLGEGQSVLCVACSELRAAWDTRLPANAVWDDGGACGRMDWICTTGYFKSLETEPVGCCPSALAPARGLPGPDANHCNWQCNPGLQWDPVVKDCIQCPGWVAAPPPPRHSHWNDSLCSWECDRGYSAQPPLPARPQACLECAKQAAAAGWSRPSNSEWLPGPPDWNCSQDSWQCAAGYVRHGGVSASGWPGGGFCCDLAETYVPSNVGGLGGWVAGECRWECKAGRHPQVPKAEWAGLGRDCLTCREFLAVLGVNCSECGRDKHVKDDATLCAAEATAVYTLSGMSEQALSYKAQMDFWAAAAASALRGLEITGLDRRIPWVREASGMLQIAVTFDPIEATRIAEIKKALAGGAGLVQQNTAALGYPVEVAENVLVRLGPSIQSTECVGTSRMNGYTGQCCERESPTHLATGHNWHRYTWDVDGCSASCCRTCAEINAARGRVKPPNSEWHKEDVACYSWTCMSGFVRSEQACVPEVRACSGYSTCSDCTASATGCVWCASQQRCSSLHDSGCANQDWVEDPGKCSSQFAFPHFLFPLISCIIAFLCSTATACVYYWRWARPGRVRGRGQEQHVQQQPASQGEERGGGRSRGGGGRGAAVRLVTPAELAALPTFIFDGTKNRQHHSASDPTQFPARCDEEEAGEDADEKEEVCSICLCGLAAGEECRLLPCMHVYHRPCIDKWLAVGPDCPLCKHPVTQGLRLPPSRPPSPTRAASLPSTHEATALLLSMLAQDPPSGSLQVSLGGGIGAEFAFPGRVQADRDRDPPSPSSRPSEHYPTIPIDIVVGDA